MRVVHITPSFHPATIYGGSTEAVNELCRHVARLGVEVRVLTTDANGPENVLDVDKDSEIRLADGLSVRYHRRVMPEAVSPALLRALPGYLRWADLVHLTAVYSFPTIPTLFACRLLGRPAIWSPHGALQRWAGSTRVVLKGAWEHVCRTVASHSVVLHVTSEAEAHESRARFPGAGVALVPNGVMVPDEIGHVAPNGALRLLYLGRLHPKKGIENLLAGLARLGGQSGPRWSLVIAGGGERGYAASLGRLVAELGLSRQVTMAGEVSGEAKRELFERSDVVVVPSYTENFGMVVAEALAHGVPVIASRGTPWQRLEEMHAGLWVDNAPDSLASAIRTIGRMPRRDMGERGRAWMRREFSWDRRAREMVEVYSTVIAG